MSLMKRTLGLSMALGLFIVLAPSQGNSQTFRGTILGSVVDATGAAIPGATVVIKNQGTGQTRTTTSGRCRHLHGSGTSRGTVRGDGEQGGFESMTVGGVEVTVAGEHRVDVTLQPGKIESHVEVEASAPLVSTTENTLGGTIQSSQVAEHAREWPRLHQADLPAAGRERRTRTRSRTRPARSANSP